MKSSDKLLEQEPGGECEAERARAPWLSDVLERVVAGRTKVQELESLLAWAWQADWRRLPYRPEHHDGQTTLVVRTGCAKGSASSPGFPLPSGGLR